MDNRCTGNHSEDEFCIECQLEELADLEDRLRRARVAIIVGNLTDAVVILDGGSPDCMYCGKETTALTDSLYQCKTCLKKFLL